jgi:predicted amidohydrolase
MADTLNIALIQSHLHWEDPEENRKMFAEKMASMPETVDMVVLPEMFTSGFTMHPENLDEAEGDRTLLWMKEWAQKRNTAITGSMVYRESGHYFNRLFFVYPDGTHKSYDKKHSFTLAGEDAAYTAGKEKVIVEYKGFKICPLICYDLRFPVWARNAEGYDALIYVANWPKPRINAWDTLLQARAIENMAYCVGVNRIGEDNSGYEYPGHSAVYDCLGNALGYSEKEEIVYATLSKEHIKSMRDKLRFLEDRDEFSLLG